MMGKQLGFDYYYGIEAEQFSFYRVPRLLIKDKRFEDLSSDAKLLYGLLLDRMSLSMKNGWLDAENKVYIYYKIEEIMNDLSCARGTATKIMAELDSKKGIGLIEKKRQGLGRPDIIYVKNFATVMQKKSEKSEDDVSNNHGGGKSEKSDSNVPNASSYGTNNSYQTDMLKVTGLESTEKLQSDVLEEVKRRSNEVACVYEQVANTDTENSFYDVEKNKPKGHISEHMQLEFPEVQNLDFREYGEYKVSKERKVAENCKHIFEDVEELEITEDVTWDSSNSVYGTDITHRINFNCSTDITDTDVRWNASNAIYGMDITHRTDFNCSTDVADTNSKNVSYLQGQAECMDGEVAYKRTRTQVQKDDAFSEEELAFLRQLGIENPNEIAKERICLHSETEEVERSYPYSDMPYNKVEANDFTMEYTDMSDWDFYESVEEPVHDFDEEIANVQKSEISSLERRSNQVACVHEQVEKKDYVYSLYNENFAHSTPAFPEVQNLDFRKYKDYISESSEVELVEFQELDPNYTNTNYTNNSYNDISYNNPIYPIHLSDKREDRCDGLDNFSDYVSLIKKNLEYDLFMQDKTWNDRELYDELFEIVCDVVCVKRKSIRVSGENYPYELVKSKFLKLNSSHLTYVIDCMRKTVSKIGNIKAYMITALYNAGSTISHYYQQAVQHDMYGGGWQEVGLV